MTKRLVLSYLAVTVIVLLILELPLAVFYAQRERERFTSAVERDASVIATIYEDTLEQGLAMDSRPADEYRRRTGARVIVVDTGGVARVDTDGPVPRDFSTRQEIITALNGARAVGTRPSETLNTDLLFVAIPVASGGIVHGAVRLTLDTDEVDSHIRQFWGGLAGVAAVILAAMTLVGMAIARSMTRPVRRLQETAARFAGGDLTVDGWSTGGPAELLQLNQTMSTMAVRLAALLAEQRAFVADASHQLRTPLTALRLRLENLQARVGQDDAADLETAIDETIRLGSLVNDLLQLARADQPQPIELADLTSITASRVDIWSAIADGKHVRLELIGGDEPLAVSAVGGAIEQILDNTLDNAINAAPPGSTVTVSLHRGETTHRLSIIDQGPGLTDDDKAHALRRFWRGATDVPGTGLGLAIAHALAVASGGSVVLSDAQDHGLAVTLVLPASASVGR